MTWRTPFRARTRRFCENIGYSLSPMIAGRARFAWNQDTAASGIPRLRSQPRRG